jgi:hypothetical protein
MQFRQVQQVGRITIRLCGKYRHCGSCAYRSGGFKVSKTTRRADSVPLGVTYPGEPPSLRLLALACPCQSPKRQTRPHQPNNSCAIAAGHRICGPSWPSLASPFQSSRDRPHSSAQMSTTGASARSYLASDPVDVGGGLSLVQSRRGAKGEVQVPEKRHLIVMTRMNPLSLHSNATENSAFSARPTRSSLPSTTSSRAAFYTATCRCQGRVNSGQHLDVSRGKPDSGGDTKSTQQLRQVH